jgi:GNAT superfamily N-acetyltransferase
VEDRDLLRRALDGTRGFSRAIGLGEGAEVHELPGVTVSIVPRCPERSVVNSVSYEDPEALRASLDEIAALYSEAGVFAWTVWVPAEDRESARTLEEAGHLLDASPAAMGAELDPLPHLPSPPEGWGIEPDASVVGPLNDLAYGYDGSFERALAGFPEGVVDVYAAPVDDLPACCLMAIRSGDDCHISLVATRPELRGRGLAGGLLGQALADARAAGATTSSLVATKLGRPLYERLGYRAVGTVEMWERRAPENAAIRSAQASPRT